MPLEESAHCGHIVFMKQPISPAAYQLAFIDLDDTLLGPAKQIGDANLRALQRLRQAGIQIAIASGRHHKNITRLHALGRQEWILSSHGAVVRHEQTGELLAETAMPPAFVEQVCARGRELGFSLIAYHREGAFIEQPSPWTALYAQNAGWSPIQADLRTLDPAGFQKVLWSGEPRRIEYFAPGQARDFARDLNVLITNPELLEFFSTHANKAVGAQTLAHKLGIFASQILAFGDGSNDIELLGWAGLSVAMHHGHPAARRAARLTSPPGFPESAFARAVDLVLPA